MIRESVFACLKFFHIALFTILTYDIMLTKGGENCRYAGKNKIDQERG